MHAPSLSVVWLAAALALIAAEPSRAERPPIKMYSTGDGIAHDTIHEIVRDSRGFLWFCTAEGLSRFDGYRFRNYTQDQGLPHRSVNTLLETTSGEYLVGTAAGLSVFNPRGNAYRWNVLEGRLDQTSADPPLFRTFTPQSSRPNRRTNIILTLLEDKSGRLWAGTGDGLFQLEHAGDARSFREFVIDPHAPRPSRCSRSSPTTTAAR